MLRRIGVLTSLAVAAAMFAGVSTASAQAVGDEATCVFTGLSGQLQSADGVEGHGILNAQPDTMDGQPADVERGSYFFSGDATCAGTFGGEPVVRDNVVITSNGYYDNIVCGTGWAHDLDGDGTTIFSADTGDGHGDISIGGSADPAGYEIPFDAGNGPLFIGPDGNAPSAAASENLPNGPSSTPDHAADGDGGGMHGNVVSNYVGEGAVHITPLAPDNCANAAAETADGFNDTDEFEVAGSFTAVKVQ